MLQAFWHDLRHGARMLWKNPSFALIAILSIAIGVGANAAMYGVADALVVRPLPVPAPGEVLTVGSVTPDVADFSELSYPDYVDVRDQTQSFEALVAYRFVITSFASRPDEPVQRKAGMAISGNHFDAMRVQPTLGRAFGVEEDRVAGRDAVVVLDYDEWQQRFAADPGIIGRRVRIGPTEFTVIGVAPPGFTSIDHDVHPAFYIPLAMFSAAASGPAQADALTRRDLRTLSVKGRLKPGVTIAQAREDIEQIGATLARTYPDVNRNRRLVVRTQFEAFTQSASGTDARLVAMLMTLALMVLVVACANVAGLLTSRAPERARELAMRLAIGAGRGRLIRQLVTESLILAAAGGALGLALASGVIMMFRQIEYPTDIPLKLTFEMNERVLMVGLVLATASAILSSLVPAWRATRAELITSIKDQKGEAVRRSRLWGRSALVCGQVALALVLLTVSVFLYRSFQVELNRGPGYRTDNLLMMTFDPALAQYDGPRSAQFYRSLTERARSTPGVTSATLTSAVPMKASEFQFTPIAPEGFQFPQGQDSVTVPSARVDEGYFETLRVPIVHGRAFLASDTSDAPPVAIVNETLAARYWPQQNAIGKRIRFEGDYRTVVEIVGVAANTRQFFIIEAPIPFVYLPHAQSPRTQYTLLAATDRDPTTLAAPLREIVRSLDPNMPIFGVRTFQDFFDARIVYTTRLLSGSVAGMGLMGLGLAIAGLYGLVSYSATRRTREIGIRIAVGANPGSVLRMVLRQGLVMAVSGIVIGLVASIAANNGLRALFAQTPVINFQTPRGEEFATYVGVLSGLIVIVLFSAYLPARRAAGTDPIKALRTE